MAVQTSIVIVTFDQKEALRKLLKALEATESAPTAEILVVDNASFDGSADMVAEEFPLVKLIRMKMNRGFAAAANKGFLHAVGHAVVLCHADVIATIHVLLELADRVREGADKRVAAVMPRQIGLDKSERPYIGRLPRLGQGVVNVFRPRAAHGRFIPSLDHVADDEWGFFACCAFNADVVTHMGGFDENFFVYYADADMCRRLHDRDYRILLARDLTVAHAGGATTPPPHVQRLMRRDQLRYFNKHRPVWEQKVISAATRVRELVTKD